MLLPRFLSDRVPGSSLFLFEKSSGAGPNAYNQRVLHCGDFRASPAHSSRLWYFGGGFKVDVNYPLGINTELLTDKVGSITKLFRGFPYASMLSATGLSKGVKLTFLVTFTAITIPYSSRLWYFGGGFKVDVNYPLGINTELLTDKVGIHMRRCFPLRGCRRV
jgi:hypothetical protein